MYMKRKTLTVMVSLALSGLAFIGNCQAGGYVSSPAARAQLCKAGENSHCGDAAKFQSGMIQSATTASGFPEANGIASGGLERYRELNTEDAEGWIKNQIAPGKLDLSWQITSPASFSGWKYFITKANWQHTLDANHQLSKASFEATPFCEVKGDAQQVQQGLITHHCQLPEHQGYQLIYAVAEMANPIDGKHMSIYNLIDVDINNGYVKQQVAVNDRWQKEIATIDRTDSVTSGDVIRARFFSDNEQPSLETRITLLPDEESSWSYVVAQAINAQHKDIRAGVKQANGDINPEKGKINSIYVNAASNLTGAEISIDPTSTPIQ